MWSVLAILVGCGVAADPGPQTVKPFAITVVDEDTGRGVPLVELETVNHLRFFTDSNGIVAFAEPGLMGQRVFFHIRSHGYEFAKDGFGFRGQALDVKEGGNATLKIKRLNVAERLYRVTGGGIYTDSLLVGQPTPLKNPVLNGLVLGSDSVVNAVYSGKVYWFWGDTSKPSYPLGNFHVPGATSSLPGDGGLDPEKGVDLDYFLDAKGFAKPTCQMPGEGPTWISGLIVLKDGDKERLFAPYVKVRKVLEVYEHGLAEFDDDQKQFQKVLAFDKDAPLYPQGHPFLHTAAGTQYVYFAHPYPLIRVRADAESLKRLGDYEAFTCLKEGSRLDDPRIDRDNGRVHYAWKKNTPAIGPAEQAKLIRSGELKPEEALLHLTDVESGQPVTAHGGSVYWNAYRDRWIMIAVQAGGSSLLGEVWFAEADTPLGPWVYARKVVTHDRYSFYNPKQHPMFDKDKGRVIFFEGTYTATFSGNPDATPRYDYNQIMYKLDLADPRLALPVPLYTLSDRELPDRFGTTRDLKPKQTRAVAFFALDREVNGTVPVYAWQEGNGSGSLRVGVPPVLPAGQKAEPVFHALPPDFKDPPPNTVPLYEFVGPQKKRAYSPDRSWSKTGWERVPRPLCLVWQNPLRFDLPGD
jgi:hypothetical protein